MWHAYTSCDVHNTCIQREEFVNSLPSQAKSVHASVSSSLERSPTSTSKSRKWVMRCYWSRTCFQGGRDRCTLFARGGRDTTEIGQKWKAASLFLDFIFYNFFGFFSTILYKQLQNGRGTENTPSNVHISTSQHKSPIIARPSTLYKRRQSMYRLAMLTEAP